MRAFGVRAFTSLVYPHKPDMAAWLNQWAAQFAATTPDCLSTATFYPEPGVDGYVTAAEISKALSAMNDVQFTAIEHEEAEEIRCALEQVREWLETCRREKSDLICFCY